MATLHLSSYSEGHDTVIIHDVALDGDVATAIFYLEHFYLAVHFDTLVGDVVWLGVPGVLLPPHLDYLGYQLHRLTLALMEPEADDAVADVLDDAVPG